jgi:hypothetical protein
VTGLPRPRAKKSGRPLAPQTLAIREAIEAMRREQARMTVRGLFYALTVRGVVAKTEHGYRQVQRQALVMRREGLLPWSFVADATRWVREPETWDSVEDALTETAHTYRRNLWRSQGVRLEVWLEKDALAGLISDVTYGWGVRLMVSRGQSSDTYCYAAAQDAKAAWRNAGISTVVYALYDADTSGRDAAEKIHEKLRAYSDEAPIQFELLAVTDDQVWEWDLPTRPAKDKKGGIAVELDAISPTGSGRSSRARSSGTSTPTRGRRRRRSRKATARSSYASPGKPHDRARLRLQRRCRRRNPAPRRRAHRRTPLGSADQHRSAELRMALRGSGRSRLPRLAGRQGPEDVRAASAQAPRPQDRAAEGLPEGRTRPRPR